MLHVTESESDAHGAFANDVVVSTNAVAPGAIVRPTVVVSSSARAWCWRSQRVPQVNVGGPTARGPSIACVAPDHDGAPLWVHSSFSATS